MKSGASERSLQIRIRLLVFLAEVLLAISLTTAFPAVSLADVPDNSGDSAPGARIQIPLSSGDEFSEKYIRRIERYRRFWESFIPTHGLLQYAGSMGAVSMGLGWEYGYYGGFRHAATDIQLGLVPKFSGDKPHLTLTLKEDFYPLFIQVGKSNFHIAPINFGMYLTTIFGDDYWTREPDKYPSGYYWFSTRLRLNMYIGESVTWIIPDKKRQFAASITLFYELSVNDFGVIQYVSNSYLKLKDVIHLSFGLKAEWL